MSRASGFAGRALPRRCTGAPREFNRTPFDIERYRYWWPAGVLPWGDGGHSLLLRRYRRHAGRSTLEPGHEGLGWWARTGNVPLGYLDDENKTRATFPEVGGQRYSVPGDKVRLLDETRSNCTGASP